MNVVCLVAAAMASLTLTLQARATLEGVEASTSFPPAANCTLTPNMDCQGNDIGHVGSASADACCGACSANPGCNAFTWNGQDCYMKSACPTLAPLGPPNVAGVMHKPPVNPSPCVGSISITVDGAAKTVGVMQTGGNSGTAEAGGTAIQLYHGGFKLHLTETCADAFTADGFLFLEMLGKTISYTVDLSNVSCGCNAAVYLTAMPGVLNASGPPAPGNGGDFYCDANAGQGHAACPEIDLMESNSRVSAATLHKCSFPYWDNPSCDKGGYALNTRNTGPRGTQDFGPGGTKVDTAKPVSSLTHPPLYFAQKMWRTCKFIFTCSPCPGYT